MFSNGNVPRNTEFHRERFIEKIQSNLLYAPLCFLCVALCPELLPEVD
jgi:hypothetical protein